MSHSPNRFGGQPFSMQSFDAALPTVQPQPHAALQHSGQHPFPGAMDQYGRHLAYINPQIAHGNLHLLPQYVQHPQQQYMLQYGFQDYGPSFAMSGQQYQRPMASGTPYPQMYLPPGRGLLMHGAGPAPMTPAEWLHSRALLGTGPYTGMGGMGHNHSAQVSPQLSPVFSAPRGPPRKPRQSGFSLWVGHLPPAGSIADLKDHFSRDATTDIESLFLIAKSNCAFVNYRTEAACSAAMHRFHESRFNGMRLVCCLRKGASTTTKVASSGAAAIPALTHFVSPGSEADEVETPTIVGGPPEAPQVQKELVSDTRPYRAHRIPETFFILKSLTSQDLDASVHRSEWTTQVHNKAALDAAFKRSDNVYLVFSANKSGEYFGYARMLAPISGDLAAATAPAPPEQSSPDDGPQSILTPATATAPSGRIIDDSARGTIFWEADDLTEEDGSSLKEQITSDATAEQDLGRPFIIEWISTTRLPFFRTRRLRNALNANREVKIARDGTELEPAVGRKLIWLFHGVGS
nr:hypothetical protein B0A51_03073 [Rachicladosporium sp. CCFEE 5018]